MDSSPTIDTLEWLACSPDRDAPHQSSVSPEHSTKLIHILKNYFPKGILLFFIYLQYNIITEILDSKIFNKTAIHKRVWTNELLPYYQASNNFLLMHNQPLHDTCNYIFKLAFSNDKIIKLSWLVKSFKHYIYDTVMTCSVTHRPCGFDSSQKLSKPEAVLGISSYYH